MDSEILRQYDPFIIRCVNAHLLKKGVEPWLLPDYEDRVQEARITFWEVWKDKGKCGIPEYAHKKIMGTLDTYYANSRLVRVPRNKFYKIRSNVRTVPLKEALEMPEPVDCISDTLDMIYAQECAHDCGSSEKMLLLYLEGHPIPDCLKACPETSPRNARRSFDKSLRQFKTLYANGNKGVLH